MTLYISNQVEIPDEELEFSAIRAQGPGGQNVNKVATAIRLRFDIRSSSLPDEYKQRLLQLSDARINNLGVIVIKAQRYRSQEQNRADALERLSALIRGVIAPVKKRKPTRPGKTVIKKRLDQKSRRGKLKRTRGKVNDITD